MQPGTRALVPVVSVRVGRRGEYRDPERLESWTLGKPERAARSRDFMKQVQVSINRWLLARMALVALVAALSAITIGQVLLDAFVQTIEIERIGELVQRKSHVLQESARGLQVSARDYASWDGSADFVSGLRPDFLDENFAAASMDNLGVDLALFAGVDDEPALRANPRLAGHPERERLLNGLSELAARTSSADVDEAPSVVWIHGHAVLLARAAIRREEDPERILGRVYFGRLLEAGAIGMPELNSPMTLSEVAPLSREQVSIGIEGTTGIARVIPAGWPLAIETREPLAYGKPYQRLALWMALQVALIALVALLAMYWLVRVKVVRRLDEFTRWIDRHAGSASSPAVRLPVSIPQVDELDLLALAFNGLIDRVQDRELALHHLAVHDQTTGLGNRRQLLERLTKLRVADVSWAGACTILVINLDRFRLVNEEAGVAVGDRILALIGQRIQRLARGSDLAVCLGGDEFAMLIESDLEPVNLSALCRSLLASLATGVEVDGNFYFLRASVGYCEMTSEIDPLVVLPRATVAMRRAKRAGGHVCAGYDPRLDRSMLEPLANEQSM